MRLPVLGDVDCGCDNRKFIMFEAGRLGLTEAAILVAAVAAVIAARRIGK